MAKDAQPTSERKAPAIVTSQELPLKDITPNKGQIPGVPKNPRIFRDNKFRLLVKSIEEDPEMLGLREILLYPYDGKLIIIGGNMRYQALKELNYTTAIVKILPADWTADKLRAIVIKDNSGFGEWDWDALANEWEAAQLIDWGLDVPDIGNIKAEDEAEEDDYNPSDDLEGKAKAKEGDIYMLGRHRLICGDSTDPAIVDALCGSTIVDLLLTDPPYNVDYASKNKALNAAEKGNRIQKDIANDKMADGQFREFLNKALNAAEKGNRIQKDIANDKMADGQFREFLNKALNAADRHLKPGGVFYIWHAGSEGLNFTSAVKETGWDLKQVLIWNKNNMVLGRQDYQWKHEPCLYGWKPGAGHYFIDSRSQLTVYQDGDGKIDYNAMTKAELIELLNKIGQLPTDIIDEDKPLRSADHPTMKPLKLMGRCIKNSTRPGEVVLDLFGGSGSTLMAAEQLGRNCFMVELDPHYIDVIIKRWEEYTNDKAQYLGNINEAK